MEAHLGITPHIVNNLRVGIVTICQNSGVHPTICALVLRELSRGFDNQAEAFLQDYLAQAEQERKGVTNNDSKRMVPQDERVDSDLRVRSQDTPNNKKEKSS